MTEKKKCCGEGCHSTETDKDKIKRLEEKISQLESELKYLKENEWKSRV